MISRFQAPSLLALSALLTGCAVANGAPDASGASDTAEAPSSTSLTPIETASFNELNLVAGGLVLYELQVRTANACHPDVGSPAQRAACRAKIAPSITYKGEGTSCSQFAEQQKIKLGTLDDMLEATADFQAGITLRYVKEKVGANTVWLMPLFPNNDTWSLPDACDSLGSPYAVRDYLHASASLSRACIQAGRDESSASPCWGNDALDAVIAQAHARGVRVMLDVAFNHFGHNYTMYDALDFTPVRERTARGEDLSRLWDFAATYDDALLHPDVLDSPAKLGALTAKNPLQAQSLGALKARCPALAGNDLVRAFDMWRVAFDWERASFACDAKYLESGVPGFYLGRDAWSPARALGDNFTNNWRDVKFLFHREENTAHGWEFVREREYLFRVMNHWASRGVDGFRLDHTFDPDSGIGPNEWKYLTTKLDYYAWRRGQPKPVYLAEEFSDQMGMNKVVDVMTEGYVGDMTGRGGVTKDAWRVERIVNNLGRFGGHAFVMTALETHDEARLLDGTGFGPWTGAGFWGIGAAQRSTPMILMGQELGERYGLAFRKSDFLRSRFVGSETYTSSAPALVDYYHAMIAARLDPRNRALLAPSYAFLRTPSGGVDGRILAQAKWSDDGNVVFVFHNLWEQDVAQSYVIEPWLANALKLRADLRYRLVDALSEQQLGACHYGGELARGLYVAMSAGTRAQWMRLELCP